MVASEENVGAGRRFNAVVARAADYHGDQPSNNVTASGRELCGGGSPHYSPPAGEKIVQKIFEAE